MSVNRLASGSPLIVIWPPLIGLTPEIAFSSVLLPAPLSPITATISPGSMVSDVGVKISRPLNVTDTSLASRRSAPRSSRAITVAPSNTIPNGPMPISAPAFTRARSTSSPSSRVPLRESRSTTSTSLPAATSSAWKRDTLGSDRTTSLLGSRPIVIRVPSKATDCIWTIAAACEAIRVSSPATNRSAVCPI